MSVNTPTKGDLPRYEVIEYEGKAARRYPDGSIRNERGHLMAQHPAGHTITSADASTLAKSRYEQAQEAVREAVLTELQGISDIPLNTPEDAFAFVVKKQTVALIDSDKPRFDDVEKLGQIMGTIEKPRKQEPAQRTAADPVAHALDTLISLLADNRSQTVDGEVTLIRNDLEAGAE